MMNAELETPINILVVEDDDDDFRLLKRTLGENAAEITIDRVCDGMEALEYLRKEESFAVAARPDIILLDLNMPRMSGRELLQIVKLDPSLKAIPVVVLTTSSDANDVNQCYESFANCYLTKPMDLSEYRRVLQMVKEWCCTIQLPDPLV